MSAHKQWDQATKRQREAMLKAAGIPKDHLDILRELDWDQLRPLTQEMLRKSWEGPKTEG